MNSKFEISDKNTATCFKMNFSWKTCIDKLTYWRAGTWSKLETKTLNLILRIHYDQLLITADNKVLESLNMQCKIKGIYKGDILILIIWHKEQAVRKIKFQIKSNVEQCLKKMSKHFPIINHNSTQSPHTMKPRYRNLDVVMKNAIDRKDAVNSLQIPPSYNDFVKLCLLDPAFPQMVAETEKVLLKFNKNDK